MKYANNVALAGHPTRNPTVHESANGNAVCELGLAVSRVDDRREAVLYIDVEVFDNAFSTLLGTVPFIDCATGTPAQQNTRRRRATGSVFPNDVETGNGKRTVCSVNLQKRYKDGDDVKYVSSFGMAEIPQAIAVLQMAQREFEAVEAELSID